MRVLPRPRELRETAEASGHGERMLCEGPAWLLGNPGGQWGMEGRSLLTKSRWVEQFVQIQETWARAARSGSCSLVSQPHLGASHLGGFTMRPGSGPTSTRESPWTRRKAKMKADGRHSEDEVMEANC